ncbi:fungal-specific transcription factor domain-containing protein [Lophiotrema nucula]|uniref:Fungal-specific transcription factor domain-containing protein n=1 Tax=Lophiotrema nucula TaxID=690887 RepID=A0A6A5ZN54_9PLEO|nr:fungal-specific transcription factor domain-containing protein [Lophiotrema nucula]
MIRSDKFGTACRTCRRRGRKCDRTLPACLSCSKRGVVCEGYVLRWVGAAARGPLAGQVSTAKRSKSGVGESTLLAESRHTKDVSNAELPPAHAHIIEATSATVQESGARAISVLRRQNWGIPNTVEADGDNLEGLIEYYGRELSAAFYLGYGPAETPYTCHILPMTRSIPFVRCAVAALASCHLANRLDDDLLRRQSLHLRVESMESLRANLKSGDDGLDLGRLACMLLLAQLDLCSGDCIEFGTHLEAASTYIKSRGSDGTERGFFEQRLAWLDVMGATTTLRMPHWTSKDIKATLNKFRTPSGREWGFDVFYCPIDLLEYTADITVLYKVQPDLNEIGQEATQKAILLGNAVRDWDASAYISDSRSHILEVWRLGIILYLVRLFQLVNDIFNTMDLLENIFRHARAIPDRKSWNVSTTWPLFQAGLLLSRDDKEAKAWLRRELLTNYQTLGCFNLYRAVETLDQAWQLSDDDRCDFFTSGLFNRKLVL